MNNYTHRIEDAHLLVDEEHEFWHCDVEVTIQQETMVGGHVTQQSYYGTIYFTHAVPQQVFTNGDGHPKQLDVTATNDSGYLELENILTTLINRSTHEIEFVSENAEIEVSGPPRDEPEPDRDRIQSLAGKIQDVVDE